MSDYIPIACADHERLEYAVLRRQYLRLSWMSEDGREELTETVRPLDVATQDGAEWLTIARPDGQSARIRLDHIRKATPLQSDSAEQRGLRTE